MTKEGNFNLQEKIVIFTFRWFRIDLFPEKNSSLFSKSHSLSMHSTNNLAKSVSTPYHIILQAVTLIKREYN